MWPIKSANGSQPNGPYFVFGCLSMNVKVASQQQDEYGYFSHAILQLKCKDTV
jgi:hypothetical protein